MESLDIMLLGKEYRVSCTPENKEGLLAAVALVDAKLNELASKTQSSGEKLAVMTALNIAHEFLQHQRGNGFDMPAVKRRIGLMQARLDGVLAQQDKLF
ncbi:cell division protein ZapA [Azoarcus communis]|uniref:Cell division protein ZapA n=1 Tax=Parazoarcus communis SWub3 = DSM 12120 TaxID=1121029 RepID=A0A323V231_9RHOO|nr:cell division protein ZapA [Parazoarcus communis]NMG47869.1 cell division protein ZapA [Parazoarcus communis]NMG69626.1 cell division protein ZapA [Parazoarcus communis SWub3 = DSM 12120]PZA17556.1 cell division protein ZapA [Azoarcus communis] [Parazoarcus communis SWub3 = DSM 12120]